MAFNSLKNYHIISAASMAASVTSDPQPIQFQDNIGIELVWTGSAVGVFSVQVSINYDPLTNNAGSWVTLTLSPGITAGGTDDTAYIELNQLSAPWVRIVYTRTSGTGTLDAYIAAKGV